MSALIDVGILVRSFTHKTQDCILSLRNQTEQASHLYLVCNQITWDSIPDPLKETITHLPEESQNLAIKRNAVLNASNADWLLFLDDDCIAPQDWIRSYSAKILTLKPYVAGIGGPNQTPQKTVWEQSLQSLLFYPWGHGYSPQLMTPKNDQLSPHLSSCNVAYRRAALLNVGGFDQRFSDVSEDLALSCDLVKNKQELIFTHKQIVKHQHSNSFHLWIKKVWKYGKGQAKCAALKKLPSSKRIFLMVILWIILAYLALSSWRICSSLFLILLALSLHSARSVDEFKHHLIFNTVHGFFYPLSIMLHFPVYLWHKFLGNREM